MPGVRGNSTSSITPGNETMTVILDIDLDYFALFNQPVRRLEKILAWAERPVDFMVRHHHEAFRQWRRMAEDGAIRPPHLIIHLDEHHDMMSETPPVNFGSFMYFAMRQWSECQVYWVMPQPIDYPDMWLSAEAWDTVSSRFSHFKRFRQQWPKPDLVSVCTSPGFIDERLSQRLVERVRGRPVKREAGARTDDQGGEGQGHQEG
jgi:hypothetical protein